MSPEPHELHYRRFRALARLLDDAVRIPGTRIGLGLDALLGLLPVGGDLASGAIGGYGLWVARRMGAPASVLLRMAGNLALDAVIGAVPLLGDLFDVGFRANLRNLALLDAWLARPARTQRASALLVVLLALGLLALVAGSVAATVALGGWLLHALRPAG